MQLMYIYELEIWRTKMEFHEWKSPKPSSKLHSLVEDNVYYINIGLWNNKSYGDARMRFRNPNHLIVE